jgi:DNA-directed RNA polymerase specialized sigma24 family protein
MGEPLEVAADIAADDLAEPDIALLRQEAVRGAISLFLELVPAQRSCVILKDVLDYSLDEIAAMLELSVSAVKAALHRGRTRLREFTKRNVRRRLFARRRLRWRAMPLSLMPATGMAFAKCLSMT